MWLAGWMNRSFPGKARLQLAAAFAAVGAMAVAANAAAQTSFGSCPNEAYQTIGTTPPNSTVTLYEIDLATGTLTALGGSAVLNGVANAGGVNAIGFNSADGFLYGFNNATDQIVRIGQGGQAATVGAAHTALAAIGMIGGDIIGGQLYTYAGSNLYVFNTTTGALVQTIPASAAIGGGDFAYNPLDGLLYAVSNAGTVVTVNPATGSVASLGGVSLPAGGYGATYFDNQGSLYAYDNTSGNIYRVRNLGKAGQDVVDLIANGPTTTQNDGTRCAAAPPPAALVEVAKSLQAESIATDQVAQPSEQLTYLIALENVGLLATPGAYAFHEVLPANTRLVSVAGGSIDCSVGAVGPRLCTLTTAGAIGAGASQSMQIVVEVDNPLPAGGGNIVNVVADGTGDPPPTGCSASNQACTVPPSCDPVTDPDHCVVIPWALRLDARVTKTVDATTVSSGGVATYTLTVDNPGEVPVVDAVLVDSPDSGQDCTGSATVTCIATGAAQCPPAPIASADLLGSGLTLPLIPVGDSLALTLACDITASGN